MSDSIYLDYAAATPVDPIVLKTMEPFFTDVFYNPSSTYLASRSVKKSLDDARASLAHWLGCRPAELVFTAGATEANNLAIHGVMNQWESSNTVTSAIEHESVVEPVAKYDNRIVGVDERGLVNLDELVQQIDTDTVMVSVIYANNEIGTVQHLSEVAKIVRAERDQRIKNGSDKPIYFHTDASQAGNYLDLHVDKLGVDLLTLNGGKTYGPKQSGALYVRGGIELDPLLLGGGQERGLRSGTENVASAIGLAKAFEIAQSDRKQEGYRVGELSMQLRKLLVEKDLGVEFLGHKKHRLPNLVSVLIEGIDGERVTMMLDEAGFQTGTGSACSALSDESSHVIKALGKTDSQVNSTLRFSFGRPSKLEHVEKLAEILPNIIQEARLL